MFTTTPTTISLANFRQSLLGSWINFLQNDPRIKDRTFAPDNLPLRVTPMYLPDREELFKLPTIVVHRLKEEFGIGRIGNLYQTINQTINGVEKVTSVRAMRLMGMYQFDLITRDLNSQFILSGYLDDKFMGDDKLDDSGLPVIGVKIPTLCSFTVKDLSQRATLQTPISDLPDTDVKVLWRPYHVRMVESLASDKEMEQISYTVEFWCDLWYSEHEDCILSISVEETRFTHDE